MTTELTIGRAAEQCGVKVPTIRYYEEIGLLGAPARTGSGRRLYGPAELERLRFIRHARALGFEIEAIRALIALQEHPDWSCAEADSIAREHLTDVRQKISSLRALEAELERMTAGCAHGTVADCRVIEVLADHGQCEHHGREGEGA